MPFVCFVFSFFHPWDSDGELLTHRRCCRIVPVVVDWGEVLLDNRGHPLLFSSSSRPSKCLRFTHGSRLYARAASSLRRWLHIDAFVVVVVFYTKNLEALSSRSSAPHHVFVDAMARRLNFVPSLDVLLLIRPGRRRRRLGGRGRREAKV
ncbi:unnamed protein product [Heligmosomoides polygyrus]|uniref:Secreted protein n=1 Tax=Heligmosomoides polygyrus TaxID=6339 RepID=A0A183FDB4_HELPZ|nr:unnamed protein product [Heligmosomoides polygyrus]